MPAAFLFLCYIQVILVKKGSRSEVVVMHNEEMTVLTSDQVLMYVKCHHVPKLIFISSFRAGGGNECGKEATLHLR